MGEEEEEHPQNSPLSAAHHFPVGSAVEVLENDAGVRYVGTVIPPPRNVDPKNQGKLHVMYKTLLASKGRSDHLREFVDVSSVRPWPPPSHKAGKGFEVNDVVEAYYKDGWWEGFVTAVVDGGERFVVTFENPPDEREFAASRLRPLWDWGDGVWIWPQREEENGISVGDKVEVSIERDCAWFPAVIVRYLGNGVYSVDKNGEEEVGCGRIRPCPPVLCDGKFGVSEKVDAFFNCGWWSGVIQKKVKKKNEFIVFFEQNDSTKQLDRSELRPHLVWTDEKWVIESSTSKRKSTFSDSRASPKKHKPQIETETEHVDEDRERIQDVHIPPMLPLIDNDDDSVQKLPFVKRNAIWKSMESMEELLHQRPHFEPLLAVKENKREGLAIGCMVTFMDVVEASRSLKFSDPKNVVEDLQETLLDLERYGFQVGAVRERVMKLLEAKEKEETAKGIMEQIEVRSERRGVIEKKMRLANEQLKLSEVEMEKEVEEIGRLQARLEENRQQVESLRADLEGGTASVCNGD